MRYFVTIQGRTLEVDLAGPTPRVDGVEVQADLAALSGTGVRHLRVDGRSMALLVRPGDKRGRWDLVVESERYPVEVVDERTRAIREMTGAGEDEVEKTITAPMPGLVVRVEVQPGDRVRAGQGVVIVEAMKMENELKAPADGTVASVAVEPGQAVEKGAVLLTLE